MKKIIAALSGALMIIPFVSGLRANALNFPLKSQINSESAIVVNLDSDVIIHEKNADAQQMPGALVNIMTAVVCLESCGDLNQEVTIDDTLYPDLYTYEYPDDLRFADIYGGDVLTISDLLHAMMLTSSVEASTNLVKAVCGNDANAFVEKMNAKAKEIGLTSTNFTNATGLYDTNQYTTARDMAKLTEYALSVPLFEGIATTGEYNPTVPNLQTHPNHQEWIWKNSNIMMDAESEYFYSGAKGIKTANLTAAGRNIITMGSRDGNNYLVVLLKAPINGPDGELKFYHIEDAISVFDWAFNHFSYQVILAETVEVGELPVTLAEGNDYVLARPKEEVSLLWYDEVDTSLIKKDDITWDYESVQAPVNKGQRLGEVSLKYSGEELGKVELIAVSNVKRSVSKYNLYAAGRFKESKWFKNAFIISGILCAIYIIICVYSYICYKRREKTPKSVYAVPKMKNSKKKKSADSRKNSQ